jgi:hypothetical protein
MTEFEQAWIVMCRDSGVLDGDELDFVSALRVYWAEAEALTEVERLRHEDPSNDHFYYYEETEAARRS